MVRSILLLSALFLFGTGGASAQDKIFTLSEIWQKAIAQYPSLKSRKAVVEQLKAERDLIKTKHLPGLNIQAQQNYGTQKNIAGSFFPLPGNFNTNGLKENGSAIYGSGVLQWDIFSFGKINKQVDAAGALLETGVAAVEEEVFSLQMVTARLYLQALKQNALTKVMETEEKRFADLLEFTTSQAAAGLIPGADSFLVLSSLKSASAQKQDFLAGLHHSLERISAFIGLSTTSFLPDTGKFLHPPKIEHQDDFSDHPHLQTLEQKMKYADAYLLAQKADVYPSISLLGGAGFKGNGDFSPSPLYLGGIGLTWNLSSLYENNAKKRLASQKIEEVKANYQDAELQFRAEYNAALQNESRYHQKMMQSFEALELSRNAFELYRARFESGLIGMIDLLQLQENVQNAEVFFVNAVYDYWNELLNRAAASGDASFIISSLGF